MMALALHTATAKIRRMLHTLVLVPTHAERNLLAPLLAAALRSHDRIELCGFGPIAAAARTAALISTHAPARVILAGIAGRYHDRLEIGAAYRFDRVACFGVGVGSVECFVSAGALGWQQWPGDADGGSPAIGDLIACAGGGEPGTWADLLLTACAASASAGDVQLRRRAFPAAVAEDMEGFAVALACRLHGVPVDIVRGISNTAGDRDPAHWQVQRALEAAGRLAVQIMADAT